MLKVGNPTPKKKSKRKARNSRVPRALPYEKILHKLERLNPKNLHKSLALAVVGIAVFGLVMVYSASWYNSIQYYGTRWYYFQSQLIGFVLGLGLMTIAYFTDFRILKKFYIWLYILGLGLLILVFIPGIGIARLGSSRWIGIGGFSMQPSEIAKFTFIIFASAVASKSVTRDVLSIKKFALILCAGGSYCALILLEPNLSITLCLGMSMFLILFLCGAKVKHLLCVIAPALVALPVMLFAEPYRVRRLLAFIDPWANPKDEGFQLIQSLFGLGNGGFFGVGFGNSTQKHMFLPFSESDFIFSIIGEEFGFVGCILFIAVLVFIVTKIFQIGMRCNDLFGRYFCFGVAVILFIQSAVNLAVVTGTIPPTGVPLPFISFGGTSLAVYMAVIGVILNIEKHNRQRK